MKKQSKINKNRNKINDYNTEIYRINDEQKAIKQKS